MNTFGNTKSKNGKRDFLGGALGFYDEESFEQESSISVSRTVHETTEAAVSLFQEIIGTEPKTESSGKFPTKGSIDFQQQQAQMAEQKAAGEKVAQKRIFFQTLKEDQDRARKTKEEQLFEDEINDITSNMSTDQKNELLHYQASYKDRSIYQKAELRKKIIEMKKAEERKAQQASMAATNPASQVVKEGDLINKEGSSKYGGVGDTGGVG